MLLLFLLKYRYWILFGFFGLWMLFFDSNNFFYRNRLGQEIADLKQSISVHQKEITTLRTTRNDLISNPKALEKFAREKYFMKKSNEDVFIISIDSSEND